MSKRQRRWFVQTTIFVVGNYVRVRYRTNHSIYVVVQVISRDGGRNDLLQLRQEYTRYGTRPQPVITKFYDSHYCSLLSQEELSKIQREQA